MPAIVSNWPAEVCRFQSDPLENSRIYDHPAKVGWDVLLDQPYPPDFTSSDYNLFRPL